MKRTAVFTIVSKNYLHFARTLMASVEQYHPEWDRHVLLVDEANGLGQENFIITPIGELALPNHKQFLFRYTILELNTAVKPFVFTRLFEQNYDRVIYLDPDICLYRTMDEVVSALDGGILMVLTPHLTGMLPADGKLPGELEIMKSGVYNLGFLAVSRHKDTQRFLNWWQQKLEYDCVVDFASGRFVDQKWMDLVPGFFRDVFILHHEGYNVAYWNLATRNVEKKGGRYLVNGQPLVFFHFSGLNPLEISYVSKYQDRYSMDGLNDVLQELFREYAENVLNAGYNAQGNWEYSYARFYDGTLITGAMRKEYRENPQLVEKCGSDPFNASRTIRKASAISIKKVCLGLASYTAHSLKPYLKETLSSAKYDKIKLILKETGIIKK